MHEGGEMTTTDGTGGIKVITWYQNNLRYITYKRYKRL